MHAVLVLASKGAVFSTGAIIDKINGVSGQLRLEPRLEPLYPPVRIPARYLRRVLTGHFTRAGNQND